MLSKDRLFPLLAFMKDQASTSRKGLTAFYQDLALPDMMRHDAAMAYNIGDVAGQSLIFEQLLACKDKDYIFGRLYAYSGKEEWRGETTAATDRTLSWRPIVSGQPRDISQPAFQLQFLKGRLLEQVSIESALHGQVPIRVVSAKINVMTSSCLKPWEHDYRVAAMRNQEGRPRKAPDAPILYELPPPQFMGELYEKQKKLLHAIGSPTLLFLPHTIVLPRSHTHVEPIVRAGTMHVEALCDFLHSPDIAGAQAPPGFYAAPGSQVGLPP
ncbi:hypothetical protein LTR86_007326 [Recurvomyces mirabilis]|nr:hypothetical protein LTR86_007326 [Recurvomyces mirabilis]